MKLLLIRALRALLDGIPSRHPKLVRLRRRLELGYLYRTDMIRYRVERAREMGARVGEGCRFFSLQFYGTAAEMRLIDIGDDVIISGDVTLLPHDGTVHAAHYRELPDLNGYYGRISIGNNCYLAYGSIIMANVRIGDGTIVTQGSVVRESFPENVVVMGNPARIVCTREEWVEALRRSPNTVIDPRFAFPAELPLDELLRRVGELPIREPRAVESFAPVASSASVPAGPGIEHLFS